jgi:undecaprenyl-diphosphatase
MSSRHELQRSDWVQRATSSCADADRRWAITLHRAAGRPLALSVLRLVSWLGDGPLWYATILALPVLHGWSGWPCSLQMLTAGAFNLLIYVCLKHGIGRSRPYIDCPDIRACARALDRFSFPSGHALHAVSYAMIIAHHYPSLTLALWAFVVLVAASRVTLGLHYPSDVVAGGAIGAAVAGIILAWP